MCSSEKNCKSFELLKKVLFLCFDFFKTTLSVTKNIWLHVLNKISTQPSLYVSRILTINMRFCWGNGGNGGSRVVECEFPVQTGQDGHCFAIGVGGLFLALAEFWPWISTLMLLLFIKIESWALDLIMNKHWKF